MIQFMNDPDDCQWLTDTHLRGRTVKPFKSFVLHGNEDAPTRAELYTDAEPRISDTPQVIEF